MELRWSRFTGHQAFAFFLFVVTLQLKVTMPSSNPLSYPPTQPLQFMRSVAVHPEWDVPTGASRRGGHQEKEQRQRKEQKGNFRNRVSLCPLRKRHPFGAKLE